MAKRCISTLLIIVAVLSIFTSCGKKNDDSKSEPTTAKPVDTQEITIDTDTTSPVNDIEVSDAVVSGSSEKKITVTLSDEVASVGDVKLEYSISDTSLATVRWAQWEDYRTIPLYVKPIKNGTGTIKITNSVTDYSVTISIKGSGFSNKANTAQTTAANQGTYNNTTQAYTTQPYQNNSVQTTVAPRPDPYEMVKFVFQSPLVIYTETDGCTITITNVTYKLSENSDSTYNANINAIAELNDKGTGIAATNGVHVYDSNDVIVGSIFTTFSSSMPIGTKKKISTFCSALVPGTYYIKW